MKFILEKRPRKKSYQLARIAKLKKRAAERISEKLLPDEKIVKIVLVGSSIKNSFGEYDAPGFRDSLFSDFDFVVFVEDDYEIPEWLNKSVYDGPFANKELNLTYRNKRFVEGKFDIDVLFIKRSNFEIKEIKIQGEKQGIPMFDDSKNKYLMVYKK